MSRQSRKKRTEAIDTRNGILLGVGGLILIVALIGGYLWLKRSKVQIDEANCPLTGPYAVHVLLFDRSDPISDQQSQRIRQEMRRLKDAAAFGQRFDVYTFEGDAKSVLDPVIKVCSPGRPEDANELIENPQLIRRRYEERFSSVLDRTVDHLLQKSTRSTSPIVESLRAAAISSFGSIDSNRTKLRITMISDMIQHSSAFSHVRSEQSYGQLSKNSNWPTIRPDLKGAQVEILYLLRLEARRQGKGAIQNRGHQLFWEELIRGSGGMVQRIEPI